MKTGGILLCLLVCLLSVYATHDDPVPQPFTPGGAVNGLIFPCNRHYFSTNGFQGAALGTYARVEFNWTNYQAFDDPSIFIGANFIPSERRWTDFCELGTPSTACVFFDICRIPGTTAYVTIDGGHRDALQYTFNVISRAVTVTNLGTQLANSATKTLYTRPSNFDSKFEPPLYYDHYYFQMPAYQPGMFLVVNITGVQSNVTANFPSLYVNYNQLATTETSCVLSGCTNSNNRNDTSCFCTTDSSTNGDHCGVVVLPCYLQKNGTYFFSVKLAEFTRVNYTITAAYYNPYVLPLTNQLIYQYTADTGRSAHHVLRVNSSMITPGVSRLRVTVNNVVGAGAYIYIQQGELAGGKDGCHTALQSCITQWACNLYVPPCAFYAGDWYIAVDTYGGTGSYRLPLSYSIQAAIEPEPTVMALSPGDVIVTSIKENDYQFYSVDIPNTVDTWLYAELYLNRNDSEVWFAMHPGSIVGPYGSCYPMPPADNWTCSTGGASGNREACYFHLQTCYLQPGKVYFTVWSKNFTAYGHELTSANTFYAIPTEYTLRITLEEPRRVLNNVSYSEHVYPNHYQHYFLPIDNVVTGEHLTVHFANVQRGTITGYVYLNDLAGECPCYHNIRNCTASGGGGWCDLQIDTCLFQSGIWYVSARGNSLADNAAVPIGYTLTVIRNPAPPIEPLILDTIRWNYIGWNESHHYMLPVPTSSFTDNLIIKVILDQDQGDAYELHNLVAYNKFPSWYEDYWNHHCYEQYCFTNLGSNSYCTIRIPSCDWNALGRGGNFYLSVYTSGWADFTKPKALYTIRTFLETDPVHALASGAPVYDKVQNFGYQHYYLDLTNGTGTNNMLVEIYTNNDQDKISFRMNINNYAASIYDSNPSWSPCNNYLKPFECNTTTSCMWQINNCDLKPAIYYFSVYGISRNYEDPRYMQQYYDVPVEFTLTVTLYPQVQTLNFDYPVAGYLVNRGLNQYQITIPPLNTTMFQYFVLETANARHGTVKTYVRQAVTGAKLAGPCPCYEWDWRYDTADATGSPAGSIGSLILPYCWLKGQEGLYTIAVEDITPDTDAGRRSVTQDLTPTAYTLTASLITPMVQTNYTVPSRVNGHVLGNNRYWHYQINVAATVTMPQQLQIFLYNVKNGAVDVFLTKSTGAAFGTASDCYAWKSPSSCSGTQCQYVIPDCVWNNQGTWWISVLGHASLSVTYDLETRLRAPTSLSLLNTYNYTSLYGFIDHYKFNVPGGTTLVNYLVFDILNVNNPVNVYINPGSLAGASGCGKCVHAINTEDGPVGTCVGTCKYRVPSCFYKTGDWYLAIDPRGAVNTNYTIKVTQQDSTGNSAPITAGTAVSLTGLTGIESWQVFTFPFTQSATNPTQLVISGTFGTGSAAVRMLVNHTNSVAGLGCGDWQCSSDDSATCTFVLDSCCAQTGTYRIGFYQVTDGSRTGSVLVNTWPEHGTQSLSLNGGAVVTGADADGVAESTYRHFRLNIPTTVFSGLQTVYLNVSILSQTSGGSLNVYLRPNYQAGALGRCYSNILFNTATFATPVIWELPHCVLTNADWYIGLYNPANHVTPSAPVWFSIEAKTYAPQVVNTGPTAWYNSTVDPTFPVTWLHFQFNVDPTDIAYHKKYLKVEIIPIAGTISALYLNYGALAGNNRTLGNLACAFNCQSSPAPTLLITVESCQLRSGTWFAAAKVGGGNTQYAFRAQIVTQDYTPLGAPAQISGTGEPLAYRFPLAQQVLTNPSTQGNAMSYYSFVITPDMIRPTTKLTVNVTDVAGGKVTVTIFKDCGLTWSATVASSLVIAEQSNQGPCALIPGEYLMVVDATVQLTQSTWYSNFTVAVYMRDAAVIPLPMTGFAGVDHDHVYTSFHDVWQINVPQLTAPWSNQTLGINFNVSCGMIKAYLNYGTPGGPDCFIASCSSGATTGTNPATRYNTDCVMYLDTCQVQPGTYYVTVIGAGQEFTSQYVYQQVNYEIWATPVYYNFTGIAADTWYGNNRTVIAPYPVPQLTNDWRQYWYVDQETSNPGSRLKFTLNGTVGDSLFVAYENAFAVTTSPSSARCTAPVSCTIASGTTCNVTIDSCALKIGRYYALAKVASFPNNWIDERIRVWRQEVDIPYLWANQPVTGTVGDDYPQFYKILVINPSDAEFYGDFLIYNVDLGTITATLSHVAYGTQTPGQQAGCLTSTFKQSCTATPTANCSVHIPGCYAKANLTFFLEIDAASHVNNNRSVRYSTMYTLRPPVMRLPLFTRICDTVFPGQYRHWKLLPQASTPEQILYVNITTLYSPETVGLSLNDYPDRLGVEDGSTNTYGSCWRNYWLGNAPDVVTNTGIITQYECAYTDFHIGVMGKTVIDGLVGIRYLIEARTQQAPLVNLTLGVPQYFCSGGRYYFKVTVPTNSPFFQVLVDFEDNSKTGTVWVKQGSLAAPNCYDKTATGTDVISTWHIQSCGLPAGTYYITVNSPNSPFTITAKTTNKAATPINNATATTGSLPTVTPDVDATYQIYSINVTSAQMTTLNTPQVNFWLTYNDANGAVAVTIYYSDGSAGTAASMCTVPFTTTKIAPNTWQYTVKNCHINVGTYYAFVSTVATDCVAAAPAPEPNYFLKSGTVTYSITAAVTQTINPTPIALNVVQNVTVLSNGNGHYYINSSRIVGNFLYVRIFNVPNATPLSVWWSPYRPVDATATQLSSRGTSCVYTGASSTTNDWLAQRYYAAKAIIGSEVFRIDTCGYYPTDKVYFYITSAVGDGCAKQPFSIPYNFVVNDVTWVPLTSGVSVSETVGENREARFYSFTTTTMQSATLRVTPTLVDGQVSVTVQDNACDTATYTEYQWTKNCVPGQYCDIEIPTRAAHPEKGRNTFYVIVKANRANFTVTWWAGSQNCGNPPFTATSFCGTDVVNYATWNWNNWQALDQAARGLFEKLYLDFHYSRDFPCYVNCNTSLRQYACHETFRMCDTAGFITPVCKASCDHVVYYCQNWFDTVQDRQLNCTSHQYGDAFYGNCTGLDVKVPYPPNSFVNIQGAVAGAGLLAPSVLVILALLALYFL